jgi:hypothetical protein
MMLAALHNATATGLLMLAGGGIQCAMPKAPSVVVEPLSDPIQYDFSRSEKELSAMKMDTASPYPPGADSATGGLRVDHPIIAMDAKWGYLTYTPANMICVWYDTIKVTLQLKPHIYIANRYGLGPCRDAILAHERRHVDVDREIVNKYTIRIGQILKDIVDKMGALGPYPADQLSKISAFMSQSVKQALSMEEERFEAEERQRQAQVDTLQEYQRVTTICHNAGDL